MSGRDNVPIMAEEGEYIIKSDITQKFLPKLEYLQKNRTMVHARY